MAKNIIICFDGTCNHPSDARQERSWFGLGEIEDNGITNVLKLHALFGGNLKNEASKKTRGQRSFYYSGVGTYGSRVQQIFNAGFAPENMDVGRIIGAAGWDLKENYKKGDKIFIFGFSRGAAIARKFASVIDRYTKAKKGETPIRFLGVFDTVAAIGVPNLDSEEKPISDVVFEDDKISPYIKEALHLVSVDENRLAFQPTLMNKEKKVKEVWLPGAHADVGGGFWFDGLSDLALKFMIDEIERRKLGVKVLGVDEIEYEKLKAPDKSYRIDYEDIVIKPLLKGKSHPKDRWGPFASATLGPREIRVNIGDEASEARPLIHCSVGKRVSEVTEYRPKALKGIVHNEVAEDGNVDFGVGDKGFQGLREYMAPA